MIVKYLVTWVLNAGKGELTKLINKWLVTRVRMLLRELVQLQIMSEHQQQGKAGQLAVESKKHISSNDLHVIQ